MERISYQVEINRVLDILSKEIYDSPYALLRENIQNAYDAILMRDQYVGSKWDSKKDGLITIKYTTNYIVITDNGIGMTKNVLKNNFWNAGSSGKKGTLAKKAGVVGTFGVGAMANFGISNKIELETESIEDNQRIYSEVEKENLSITEECILINEIPSNNIYGTSIKIYLEKNVEVDVIQAKKYLKSYVEYIPVKILFNNELISQKNIKQEFYDESANIKKEYLTIKHKNIVADVQVQCNDSGRISTIIQNIVYSNESLSGSIYLRQDYGHIWGLRNYFGLAPMPISSHYSFGGIVNLQILTPTAGREAISKESLQIVKNIIEMAEYYSSETLSETDISNRSSPFMAHILSLNKIEYANKLRIRIEPQDTSTLEDIKKHSESKTYNYYEGNDENIINSMSSSSSPLIVLSRSNPRRRLERGFLTKYCNVELITDKPKVINKYDADTYNYEEASFIITLTNILKNEYLLKDFEIIFADFTHDLPLLVEMTDTKLFIYIKKEHKTILIIMKSYKEGFDIYNILMHDYIRSYLYNKIMQWVPSSTKEGADALQKLLKQKKELFEYEYKDLGFTSLLSLTDNEKNKLSLYIDKTLSYKLQQTQEIRTIDVSTIERIIPDLLLNIMPPSPRIDEILDYNPPSPAILRTDVVTDKKILEASLGIWYLNNFKIFLAITDKAFNQEADFFTAPHSTRIIWGGRRIIYIFTHASSRFSLYYDIELFEDIGHFAGGSVFPTTTIITKKKIYIPVPDPLQPYFKILRGSKKQFFVKFDTV